MRNVTDEIIDNGLSLQACNKVANIIYKEMALEFTTWDLKNLTKLEKKRRLTVYYGMALAMERFAEEMGITRPKF